jgi:hypothetical protein
MFTAARHIPIALASAGAGESARPPVPPNRATLRVSRLPMIRKLPSGEYRLFSSKQDPRTGKRRNLGTFRTRAAALRHERAVQFFKRRG